MKKISMAQLPYSQKVPGIFNLNEPRIVELAAFAFFVGTTLTDEHVNI